MALVRDKTVLAGGLDILPVGTVQLVDSNVASTWAVVGITSAIASAVSLTYNATTASAADTNKSHARLLEELIRKGVINGTFNT